MAGAEKSIKRRCYYRENHRRPPVFTIVQLLRSVIMPSELFDKGLVVRKEVLGEAYVEKSIKGADEFALAMQEFATEAAWGSIWTRPGLPRKTRSLLNIAMLTIMNRQHELKLHIRSSFTNGVTKDEIKEVLLQVAAYAGVPAGIDGFRLAREAFAAVSYTHLRAHE